MSAPIQSFPWFRAPLYWERLEHNSAIRQAINARGGATAAGLFQRFFGVHTSGPALLAPQWSNVDVSAGYGMDAMTRRAFDIDGQTGVWYRFGGAGEESEVAIRAQDGALYYRLDRGELDPIEGILTDDEYVLVKLVWGHAHLSYADVEDFWYPTVQGYAGEAGIQRLYPGGSLYFQPHSFIQLQTAPQSFPYYSAIALTKRGRIVTIGGSEVRSQSKGKLFAHVHKVTYWPGEYEFPGGGTSALQKWSAVDRYSYNTATEQYETTSAAANAPIGEVVRGTKLNDEWDFDQTFELNTPPTGGGWVDVVANTFANAPLGIAVKATGYELFGSFGCGYTAETDLADIPFYKLRGNVPSGLFLGVTGQSFVADPADVIEGAPPVVDTFPVSTGLLVTEAGPGDPLDPDYDPDPPDEARWYVPPEVSTTFEGGPAALAGLRARPLYWLTAAEIATDDWGVYVDTTRNSYDSGGGHWDVFAGDYAMTLAPLNFPASGFFSMDLIDWRIGLYLDTSLIRDAKSQESYTRSGSVLAAAVLLARDGTLYWHNRFGREILDTNVAALDSQPNYSTIATIYYFKRDGSDHSINPNFDL